MCLYLRSWNKNDLHPVLPLTILGGHEVYDLPVTIDTEEELLKTSKAVKLVLLVIETKLSKAVWPN